jgi:hypothetical protein
MSARIETRTRVCFMPIDDGGKRPATRQSARASDRSIR